MGQKHVSPRRDLPRFTGDQNYDTEKESLKEGILKY